MSTSVYVVSSDYITSEQALNFLADLQAIGINRENVDAQMVDGESNIWIKFLGSSVLDESDEEELDSWAECLGADACSFFELTIGKGEGSMQLAVKTAREAMERWNAVVDDLYESVYNKDNLSRILEV